MDGEILRELRKAVGMSQAELATAIGMARETVGAMERDTHSIEKRTELAVRYVIQERAELDILRRDLDRLIEELRSIYARHQELGYDGIDMDEALKRLVHEAKYLREHGPRDL